MLIVRLSLDRDDYAVYSRDRERGPFGTPMLFRGTFDQCLEWRQWRD